MTTDKHRYTSHRNQIGIEITNNTPEVQDLSFLGVTHRHKARKSGMEVKNIVMDTLFDDADMTMLINWIQSVGSVNIGMTVFQTSLLYGAFNGKSLNVLTPNSFGERRLISIAGLQRYFSPYDINKTPNVVRVPTPFTINFFSELTMVHIEPGEKLIIMFFIHATQRRPILDEIPEPKIYDIRKEEANADDLLKEMEKKFDASKRRKILLFI